MNVSLQLRGFAGLLLVGLLAGPGCEEKPEIPPDVIRQIQEQPADNGRPTTRQLVEGPQQRLRIGSLPLSVSVPVDWKLERVGSSSIVLLRGPTPSGEAIIQPFARMAMPTEQVDLLIASARKESQANPANVRRTLVRQLGSARVLERQVVDPSAPKQIQDQDGQWITVERSPLRWTIQVFVPNGSQTTVCDLNFLNLDLEQYQQDQKLLDQIINSLQLDAAS